MLIERKCGVLSHTINEVEGETAAAAKYQKQKQNKKKKKKTKRTEMKSNRRDETTKHKFFDDSFAARHAKKLPLPVSLFTPHPHPHPSLFLSPCLLPQFAFLTSQMSELFVAAVAFVWKQSELQSPFVQTGKNPSSRNEKT